jgi:hypothetical protein
MRNSVRNAVSGASIALLAAFSTLSNSTTFLEQQSSAGLFGASFWW